MPADKGETVRPEQDQDLIYALDIGTRSVIGMLGTVVGDRVQIRTERSGDRILLTGESEGKTAFCAAAEG